MQTKTDIENLLRPRKKVIEPYPGSPFNIGNILYYDDERIEAGYWYSLTESGVKIYVADPHLYPNIFKPLQWWEDRSPEEMPEYVKMIIGSEMVEPGVYKVKEYYGKNCIQLDNGTCSSTSFFEPATLDDYNSFIKNKEK